MGLLDADQLPVAHPVAQEMDRSGADGEIADMGDAIRQGDVGTGARNAAGQSLFAPVRHQMAERRLQPFIQRQEASASRTVCLGTGGVNVTLIGALSLSGLKALMTIPGATTSQVFRACVEQVLGPTLRPGDEDTRWAYETGAFLPRQRILGDRDLSSCSQPGGGNEGAHGKDRRNQIAAQRIMQDAG